MHINSRTKFQLGFSKFQFFNDQNGQEGGTASPCQILSTSLQPWPRYRDLSIFQDGGRRHLGFLKKNRIFNGQNGQEGGTTSVCQISSKSLEPRPIICEFQYYASLAWKCLFTPLFGVFGAHFPLMMSLIILTLKWTIRGLNHVIWAINRGFSYWFLNGPYKTSISHWFNITGPPELPEMVFGGFKHCVGKYFKYFNLSRQ